MDISKLRFRLTRRGWTITALVVLALFSYTADGLASINRVRSGVKAGSLELGGKTREEATQLLTERSQELVSQPVELFAETHRLSVTPSEVGFTPLVTDTLEHATSIGRQGNIFVRLWQRVRGLFASTDVGWESEHDTKAARLLVDDFAATTDTAGFEAHIEARGVEVVPIGAVPGRRLDKEAAMRTIVNGLETWPRRSLELPITVRNRRTTIDDARDAAEKAKEWVAESITLLAPDGSRHTLSRAELAGMLEAVPRRSGLDWKLDLRFSKDKVQDSLGAEMQPFVTTARDASFAVNAGAVSVVAATKGRTFDPEATAAALAEAAGKSGQARIARAAFAETEPELSTAEAKDLNIVEQVSTFTTNHPCCQPRVTNIHKIAEKMNNVIIRPGQRFSLNGFVGERKAENGYVLAPMIFDGEYRDSVGGGVSQFATTFYNAIFFGGYELNTHKAHSYWISRYPKGREATVSWPAPDLAFTNNSKSGILVKTAYSSTSLTVSFYGDKEGKVVEAVSGEETDFTEFEEQRVENTELEPGEEKVVQEGAQGFTITVFRVMTKDGKETRQRFTTRYKPEPKIIEFGPGTPEPSPPAPSPSPTPSGLPGGAPGG